MKGPLFGVCLVLVFSVVSAATSLKSEAKESKKSVESSSEQDELTELLGTLDADIFDPTKTGPEKYKRALSELDGLLGSLMEEINEKQKAKLATRKRLSKREIYSGGGGGGGGGYGGNSFGGGGDGWGHQEVQHGWHQPPPPKVYYKVHHHHHGIPPEFLLKTALILKGILVLGHVAAMG